MKKIRVIDLDSKTGKEVKHIDGYNIIGISLDCTEFIAYYESDINSEVENLTIDHTKYKIETEG